jgi:hypothetical protein
MTPEVLQFLAIFAAGFAACGLFYVLHYAVLAELAKNQNDWYGRIKYYFYALSCAMATLFLTIFAAKHIQL